MRSVTPDGVEAAAIRFLHVLDCGIRAHGDPFKSEMALAAAKTGAGLVVIDFCGATSAEAAARSAVAQMCRGIGQGSDSRRLPCFDRWRQAGIEILFEFADGFLHRAIVRRIAGWAIEWEHALIGSELIDRLIVKEAAVVALKEQRETVPVEEFR